MKKGIVLFVIGIILLGCTQYGGTSAPTGNNGTPSPSQSGNGNADDAVTVHIKNFAFGPAEVTVKQGGTVTWVNDDSVPHLVKFPGFASSTLSTGDTFQHTFTEAPGDYAYSCGIHPSMQGKVKVVK